jgi:MFS transporter, DHA2 family, methylenomycin A resistance protein
MSQRTSNSPSLPPTLRWMVAAASFGFAIVQLDVTVVNVALPRIGSSLAAGTAALQWVVDGYTVSFAVLLLSAGVLADRIGARRAYLGGFALFTLASVACGAAPGTAALVAARIAQGAGAALLVPGSLAVLNNACGDDAGRRARAVGVWTAAGGVAIAAGPLAGGLLLAWFDWRSIFLVNVPICALGAVLTIRHLSAVNIAGQTDPEHAPGVRRGFDPLGQLLSVAGLSGLTIAIIAVPSWPAARTTVLTAAVVALGGALGFLAVEARAASPMLPLSLFRRSALTAAIAFGVLCNLTYYGVMFVLSLYLQRAHGYSALRAGAAYLPLTATFILSNLLSAPIARRFGAAVTMSSGAVVAALGYALLIGLRADSSYAVMLPAFALIPCGMGTAVPAMTSTVLASVARHWGGTVSGALNAARQAGGAVGVAVFGALTAGGSSGVVHGLRVSAGISAVLLGVAAAIAQKWVPGRETGVRQT